MSKFVETYNKMKTLNKHEIALPTKGFLFKLKHMRFIVFLRQFQPSHLNRNDDLLGYNNSVKIKTNMIFTLNKLNNI